MKCIVVITGLIRDVVELFGVLREVQKLREQGLVKRVILSSWLSEAYGNTDLFSKLRACGIEVLLTEAVSAPIGSDANRAFSYQAVSFLRALDEIEPGAFVLKVRTDKFAQFIPRFSETIKKGLPRVDPKDRRYVGLNWKVAVTLIRASVPFHIFDGYFFGERNDLYYILNTGLSLEARIPKDGLGVENRWCVGPFFLHNSLFRSFFENFRSYSLLDFLNKWVRGDEGMPTPVAKILGAYYLQVIYSFELVTERDWEDGCLDLRSLLDPEDATLARTSVTSVGLTRSIYSIDILRQILGSYASASPMFDSGFNSGLQYLYEADEAILTRDDLQSLKVLLNDGSRVAREYFPSKEGSGLAANASFSVAESLAMQCIKLGIPATDSQKIIDNLPCRVGSENSYLEIANLYFEGRVFARSIDYGEAWLRAGARLRNRSAQLKLGELMVGGVLKTVPLEEVHAALEDLKRYDLRAEGILKKLR